MTVNTNELGTYDIPSHYYNILVSSLEPCEEVSQLLRAVLTLARQPAGSPVRSAAGCFVWEMSMSPGRNPHFPGPGCGAACALRSGSPFWNHCSARLRGAFFFSLFSFFLLPLQPSFPKHRLFSVLFLFFFQSIESLDLLSTAVIKEKKNTDNVGRKGFISALCPSRREVRTGVRGGNWRQELKQRSGRNRTH